MKKILLIAILFIAYNTSNAQISYGIKGGLNYNMVDKAENFDPQAGIGYNLGGFLRVKIPLLGLYVQGEPTYTRINSTITVDGTEAKLGSNRFDLPVLAGFKIAILRLYAGPVFSWNLGSSVDNSSVEVVTNTKNSVGGQAGVGVELGPIMLDARYEFAVQHELQVGDLNYDNRAPQLILGVAYKF